MSGMGNAAGPIMSLYLLAMRLPKEAFIGTGAWYFFILNCFKVPISVGQGLITSGASPQATPRRRVSLSPLGR